MRTFCKSRLPARPEKCRDARPKYIRVQYAGSIPLSREREGEVDGYGGFSDTTFSGGNSDCVCDITDSSALREAALGARD